MPSPFPGMDPWLERPFVYPGFHNDFLTYLRAALSTRLPAGFAVNGQSRVYVDAEHRQVRVPDLGVTGPVETGGGAAVATAGLARVGMLAAGAEPTPDPTTEVYLEILTDDDERLVTAVELLSPSNKEPGEGRKEYLKKQAECKTAGVNLVEIDFVRGGRHTTAVPEARLRALAPGGYDYHVCVTVEGDSREYFVAPFALAARLPTIGVPLTLDREPVTVELQPVFDRCYDEGGFDRLVKYATRDPVPPLTPEQKAWADAILKEKGLVP
jgi:hypothetical protein